MLPPSAQLVVDLFATTPHVMVCVKDEHSVYLAVNDMFVQRLKRRNAREIVGHTAAVFFPADLAAEYRARDVSLLRTSMSVRHRLEEITDADGERDWFLTNQMIDASDPAVPVIVAVSTAVTFPRHGDLGPALRRVIDHVRDLSGEPLRVADLAEIAGLSTDRLERAMRRALGVSPKQYLMRARVDRAAALLVTTDLSISDIAAEAGYYDQSQLTKYFGRSIGMTPHEYRLSAQRQHDA